MSQFDFNEDPVKNWLNTIIWQIKIVEEIVFNSDRKSMQICVQVLRGLFALLDETGKGKFKKEIDQLYEYERDTNQIRYFVQIEHMFSDVLSYLNSTIFREMRGVKPRNLTPEHIRERSSSG